MGIDCRSPKGHLAMHRPAPLPPVPGPPPSPPFGPPRTPWWQTGRARAGFVPAVPVLGFLNAFLGFLMLVVALFLLWWGNAWPKPWKATATVAADHTYADTIYGNDTLPDEGEYDEWKVCAHDPGRREPITDSPWVRLWLSAPENDCPAQAEEVNGSAQLPDRDDDGDPDYHDPFPSDRNRNSTFPDGLPGSSGGSDDSGGSGGSSNGSSGGGGWGGCRSRWC